MRNRLVVAAAVLALLLAWFLWWRRPAVQAPRLFQRIAAAVHSAKGGALVDQVHDRYDIAAHWPQLGDLGLAGGSPEQLRLIAVNAAQGALAPHRDAPLTLVWTLDALDTSGDDVVATVTMRLTAADGRDASVPLSLSRHRFTLARRNWLGELAVLAHDPIQVTP